MVFVYLQKRVFYGSPGHQINDLRFGCAAFLCQLRLTVFTVFLVISAMTVCLQALLWISVLPDTCGSRYRKVRAAAAPGIQSFKCISSTISMECLHHI